ncbi:CueP family metal-binding protein [Paenibacillus sp. S150]|uniref:CueP family metal-binding protein n=1 Tax=Paenibacillus sp. S150 TaxID=2749826 RepID=UPI001C55B512|nr:CueP family metal-binding protein [Paenibacillus sp. S150]MBW4084554.1 CueP family metal-binding protein [Paenibacillus sp. S150]
MRNKILVTATGLVVVIAVGAYLLAGGTGKKESGEADTPGTEAGAPSVEMDTPGMKQLVHDFSSRSKKAESASISSTQLIVKDNAQTTTYALPTDEFFVSIAPYVDKTHPCATHSLTGCQGEMVEEEFSITVKDPDGKLVMDNETVKSQPNGFIDLWLPRDQTYQVTIEQAGKKAESEISTFEANDTCITTMQLG